MMLCIGIASERTGIPQLRSVSLIHVYLLQCVAGLWSGNKRTFELVEAGRGALVNVSVSTAANSPLDT